MAKIPGLDKLAENILTLKNAARGILQAEAENFGQQGVGALRADLSHEFQEVETYTRHGPPAKKYAPGTLGVYSHQSPPVSGTPLERQAQLYLFGHHRLRDELTSSVDASPDEVTVTIGYPPDAETGRNSEAYIRHVIFGTEKMQSRNFLALFLHANRDAFLQRMRDAGTAFLQALR